MARGHCSPLVLVNRLETRKRWTRTRLPCLKLRHTVKCVKDSKPTKESTDLKIAVLDQKWSDRFNHLEALLLAKTLDKEPTFQTVKVAPSHSPLAGVVKSTQPFIKPTDPATSHLPCTDSSAEKHQSSGKPLTGQPQSDWPRHTNRLPLSPLPLTDMPPGKTVSPVWSRRQ